MRREAGRDRGYLRRRNPSASVCTSDSHSDRQVCSSRTREGRFSQVEPCRQGVVDFVFGEVVVLVFDGRRTSSSSASSRSSSSAKSGRRAARRAGAVVALLLLVDHQRFRRRLHPAPARRRFGLEAVLVGFGHHRLRLLRRLLRQRAGVVPGGWQRFFKSNSTRDQQDGGSGRRTARTGAICFAPSSGFSAKVWASCGVWGARRRSAALSKPIPAGNSLSRRRKSICASRAYSLPAVRWDVSARRAISPPRADQRALWPRARPISRVCSRATTCCGRPRGGRSAPVSREGEGRWRVSGCGGLAEPADVIDCGNAGTACG